jgi:hypothetical protein
LDEIHRTGVHHHERVGDPGFEPGTSSLSEIDFGVGSDLLKPYPLRRGVLRATNLLPERPLMTLRDRALRVFEGLAVVRSRCYV